MFASVCLNGKSMEERAKFYTDFMDYFIEKYPEFFHYTMKCFEYNENNYDVYYEALQYLEDNDMSYAKGETKGCLINDKDDEYVLKWSLSVDNYCQIEYEKYQLAVKYHTDEYFAKIIPIGKVRGLDLFLMEKCNVDEDLVYSYSGSCSDNTSSSSEECWSYDDPIELTGKCLCSFWGSDKYYKFTNFCFRFDINDIHSANIGFDGVYMPKVIDYSGYNGCHYGPMNLEF